MGWGGGGGLEGGGGGGWNWVRGSAIEVTILYVGHRRLLFFSRTQFKKKLAPPSENSVLASSFILGGAGALTFMGVAPLEWAWRVYEDL